MNSSASQGISAPCREGAGQRQQGAEHQHHGQSERETARRPQIFCGAENVRQLIGAATRLLSRREGVRAWTVAIVTDTHQAALDRASAAETIKGRRRPGCAATIELRRTMELGMSVELELRALEARVTDLEIRLAVTRSRAQAYGAVAMGIGLIATLAFVRAWFG
ncbi:hypothetical protein [Methylobacterium sp. A54F]